MLVRSPSGRLFTLYEFAQLEAELKTKDAHLEALRVEMRMMSDLLSRKQDEIARLRGEVLHEQSLRLTRTCGAVSGLGVYPHGRRVCNRPRGHAGRHSCADDPNGLSLETECWS